MRKNEIKFKLENGNTVTANPDEKGNVYKGNNPVFCNCLKKEFPKPYDKKLHQTFIEKGYQFQYKDSHVVCEKCGRELEVIETYDSWIQKERENLRIITKGADWECGFTFYGLSCEIDFGDWKLIKGYFQYHRRGWSRDQELEWYFGEPTGWLTQQGEIVEIILFKAGLIKEENLRWFKPSIDVDDMVEAIIGALDDEHLQNVFDYELSDVDREAIRKSVMEGFSDERMHIRGTEHSFDLNVLGDSLEHRNVLHALGRAGDNALSMVVNQQ